MEGGRDEGLGTDEEKGANPDEGAGAEKPRRAAEIKQRLVDELSLHLSQ